MADAYICRRGGSGGSGGGSELVIVGGTTSPTKADHNTIWLNTPNTITSCVLAATQPTGPVEGMAWITIGASGAVKMVAPVGDEWITVYPLSAKQYIGGAWVDKTAKSYQGGVWVDWVTYLLTTLDKFSITKAANATYSMNNGVLNISYSSSNGDGSDIVITYDEIINTRGRSKITISAQFDTLTYVNAGFYPIFGLVGNKPNGTNKPPFVIQVGVTKTATSEQTYTLDLSSYQGDYYFVIYSAASKGNVYDILMS